MVRLGRCKEAGVILKKLHKAGYKSSSTYAAMAYCGKQEVDSTAMEDALNKAIDAADREEGAAWANRYKKYLEERDEWKARMQTAKQKQMFDVMIDDSTRKKRFFRDRFMQAMEPRLVGECYH